MNVTLVSCFRDASEYIDRYFYQVQGLHNLLQKRGDCLDLLIGYGDSTDGTGEMLFEAAAYNFGARLVDVSHGGKHYGSIEHPERFKQLAGMGNKLFAQIPADSDAVLLVESDLLWQPQTMTILLDHLVYAPAVAPMIKDGPHSFYDVFAHRKDNVRFTKSPPYFDGWPTEGMVKLTSAGSVLAMRGELARKVRFTDESAIVGLCENIYRAGGTIWLDPSQTVQHPCNG